MIVLKIFGEFLFLFGLLGWGYGVLIQLFYPDWLPLGLSHLTPWIRVDTFTILSFIVSAIGFLKWRLAKDLSKSQRYKEYVIVDRLFCFAINLFFKLNGFLSKGELNLKWINGESLY
jgi:hypothetical protein